MILVKNEIRKKYKEIRNNICEREEKSCIISEKIINSDLYKKSKVIGIYKNMKSEVNTSEIIEKAVNNEKVVALPRVKGKELVFYKITSKDELFTKSKFGVEEPVAKQENLISKDLIDLIIVPGLVFDMNKNRLGYGGGYYDRFLKDIDCVKIGICFEEQMYNNNLPIEETDIKMDIIITDKKIC